MPDSQVNLTNHQRHLSDSDLTNQRLLRDSTLDLNLKPNLNFELAVE